MAIPSRDREPRTIWECDTHLRVTIERFKTAHGDRGEQWVQRQRQNAILDIRIPMMVERDLRNLGP